MNSKTHYFLVFGAASIMLSFACFAAWTAPPGELWLSAALAAVTAGGVVALGAARARGAFRELFKQMAELKQEGSNLKRENAEFRSRLALAERRLSALAIASDLTDKLPHRPDP